MKTRDVVDLFVLAAVWGASFLFMRIATPEFGPIVLMQLRLAIAALFLIPIFLLRANVSELKIHWRKLALLGVVNSAIPFSLLAFSTLYLTAGFAAIINATAPLWAALIAWMWLSERLDGSRVIGLLVGNGHGGCEYRNRVHSLLSPYCKCWSRQGNFCHLSHSRLCGVVGRHVHERGLDDEYGNWVCGDIDWHRAGDRNGFN
jgi:hypothetical protein